MRNIERDTRCSYNYTNKNLTVFNNWCPINMHNHHEYGNLVLDKPHYMVKHHA